MWTAYRLPLFGLRQPCREDSRMPNTLDPPLTENTYTLILLIPLPMEIRPTTTSFCYLLPTGTCSEATLLARYSAFPLIMWPLTRTQQRRHILSQCAFIHSMVALFARILCDPISARQSVQDEMAFPFLFYSLRRQILSHRPLLLAHAVASWQKLQGKLPARRRQPLPLDVARLA